MEWVMYRNTCEQCILSLKFRFCV